MALLFGLASPLKAQTEKVAFDTERIPVGAMIKSIQAQTDYIFAFDSRTFDTGRIVELDARVYEIPSALGVMLAGTDHSYMIRNGFIVINSAPKEKQPEAAVITQRTSDIYRQGRPGDLDNSYLVRPVTQTESGDQYAEMPELPAPYSSYNNPDLYSGIKSRLPRFAVKSNLLYAATTRTPNVAVEFAIGNNMTIDFVGSYNPWNWKGSYEDNRKWVHMVLQPELRWWTCERFNGHFFGAHLLYTKYNVGLVDLPLLFEKKYQYEGYAFGAGVSYGYHMMLGNRWGIEFTVGVGVAYMSYNKYNCGKCGDFVQKEDKFYFGPTKLGISLVYTIK